MLTEAGYRIHTERLLANTHMTVPPGDQRRMDLVAAPGIRGVGALRGVTVFADTTVVSPLTRNGAPRPRARNDNGASVEKAARKKHHTYADIDASDSAALIVLGSEVYGRWATETIKFVKELAALKSLSAPMYLRESARHAWLNRWWSIISVGTQRAVAESLLCEHGADLLAAKTDYTDLPLLDIMDATV